MSKPLLATGDNTMDRTELKAFFRSLEEDLTNLRDSL